MGSILSLAIFDLDNTLIAGDSDVLWGEFLIRQGLVDAESYRRENQRFHEDYQRGCLDIFAFLAFALKPLSELPLPQLTQLHRQYMQEQIEPILLPQAMALIESHRSRGHRPLIITATNRFITGPIASRLGIADLLATEPEWDGHRYTGKVQDIPCYREGKVQRLEVWLKEQGCDLKGSWFYSDSHNDIPLLEKVAHPVATDPDDTLRALALAKGWDIISLR